MKPSPKNKPLLSIVILNYNAGTFLSECLLSITKSTLKHPFEIVVVDNASTDNSLKLAKKVPVNSDQITVSFLELDQNIGFSAGNNRGLKLISPHSKYVLFLNPDTTVNPDTLDGMVDYFEAHPQVDAATCHVTLALTGQLQPECHRGFPTPWNTFWHFFGFGLPKLFPNSKIFNGYFMGHLDYTKPQLIDCCVGAFLMIKKSVGNSIGWWNEKYFMYGEDLDLCYQLRKNKFSLYFIPYFKITHYQGISSGIKKTRSLANRETKIRSAKATTAAMRIFYQENLIQNYPPFLRWIVWRGIDLLDLYRLFKAKYL